MLSQSIISGIVNKRAWTDPLMVSLGASKPIPQTPDIVVNAVIVQLQNAGYEVTYQTAPWEYSDTSEVATLKIQIPTNFSNMCINTLMH